MKINSKYYSFINSDKRYCLLLGGRGSGKSYVSSQKLIIRMLSEGVGHIFLVVRKIDKDNRHSTFKSINEVINNENLQQYFKINDSTREITCKLNGNKIIFEGLDNVLNLKSMAGITGIWIEEAMQVTTEDFYGLDLLLRRDDIYKQMILTFNPDDERHFLNELFFLKNDYKDKSTIIISTFADNGYIDRKEYKELILRQANGDENYVNVNLLGLWGKLSNAKIFNNYRFADISNNYSDYDDISNGVDWGHTHANVSISVAKKGNKLFIFNEIYQKYSVNELLFKEMKKTIPNDIITIADSAEPKAIQEMDQYGIKCYAAQKGKGSVNDGIEWLQRHEILIHPSCINTFSEFNKFHWREDKKTGMIYREPVSVDDDTIAAIRYACEKWRIENTTLLKPAFGLENLFN